MSSFIMVTGAGSGIGRSIAIERAKSGYHLFLLGRTRSKLEETARLCRNENQGIDVFFQTIDLSDQTQVEELDPLIGDLRICGLVLNAGTFYPDQKEHISENLQSFMANNFYSAAYLVEYFLSQWKRSGTHFVFINSITGLIPRAEVSAYSTSKVALRGYAQNLRERLLETSCKVSQLFPGSVETPSWTEEEKKGVSLISADEIARTVGFIMDLNSEVTDLTILPK